MRKGLIPLETKIDLTGILVVDKEKGFTSHDIVGKVRRQFSIKKVGHAGTLDPNATGVIVLLLGKATKLSGQFVEQEKEYIADMKLGVRTDSGDIKGKVISESNVIPEKEEIKRIIGEFVGEIEQTPPMVSAKWVKGERLYKLARKGITVEREPKKITIKEIEILEEKLPVVVFRTVCSKGTYIRQLADDIGERLGCGAHLTELRRTRSGDFSIERSFSLSEIFKMDEKELNENIIRV